MACEIQRDEIIQVLLSLTQGRLADATGSTLLHHMVTSYSIESETFASSLAAVARSHPDAISMPNMDGETPLSLLLAIQSNKVFSSLQVLYGVSPSIVRSELMRLQLAKSQSGDTYDGLPKCGKCSQNIQLVDDGTWNHWICDHPGHRGPNSFPRNNANNPLYGCSTIKACDWGMCQACWTELVRGLPDLTLLLNEESLETVTMHLIGNNIECYKYTFFEMLRIKS